ncbi:XisI protein [Spirulina sp. 06S082]|uniref:XisI protein n=1 Tax=Spirulina sp. 06S082 TaxID=3110248 RepID=UPI002B1EC586|nr:XisI protein [Spirulina sp. 06S082]MEA5472166.1 XisI protein [Spirulina sp. 06S082]
MERVEHYRKCICKLLTEECEKGAENTDIESQLIFDRERDRYLLLDIGWQDHERIYACFIHLDIKESKIWIQRNMTEVDIAEELVNMGIPKEDIIIGLLPPYQRPYTGYGTTGLATSA